MQMKIKMCSSQQFAVAVCFICFTICAPTVDASPIKWDFAVTLRDRVLFLDDRWRQTSSAAHEFDQLKALTFDEAEEKIYFHDRINEESSIFSLRRDALVASHVVEQAVQRTGNDSVSGMAYDALNRNLFWTDITQRKILFVSIDAPQPNQPSVLVDLSKELGVPDDVVIDICRRQVYWTNRRIDHASVERISVNGTGRQTLFSKNVDMPHGIAIDHQTDRIFWIDDKDGISFAVESARLDGTDRQLVVKGAHQTPNKLAITDDTIYWTDSANNAIWSYPKPTFNKTATNQTEKQPEPTKVISFDTDVYGIVARTHFYQHLTGDQHCSSTVRKVKQNLESMLNNKPHERSAIEKHADRLEKEHCLNNATFGAKSNFCICPVGYKGARCEISECHNYCVHGTCEIVDGYPKCYCQPDFHGIRCENHKCNEHCLNDGRCIVNHESGELRCDCPENFTGKRCEHNETAHCGSYCQHLKEHPDAYVPPSCVDICEELKLTNATIVTEYQSESACSALSVGSDSLYLILSAVVLISLLLVAIIVHGVRLIRKPKRPRIKKTFVVRKQARLNSASDTPLTNRPLATEQCEITIENCCNMNVCETPCFDPKLVQQHFSASDRKAPRVKEDKKILIHSMEDDLLS